jgi:hypothetical protein
MGEKVKQHTDIIPSLASAREAVQQAKSSEKEGFLVESI